MIACNVTLMIACNVTFDGEFSKSHQPTSIAQLLKCQVCQVSLKVAPTTRLSRQRIRHSTAQHSTAQHSTTQHKHSAQHSTAQHSTYTTNIQHSTDSTDSTDSKAHTPRAFSTAQHSTDSKAHTILVVFLSVRIRMFSGTETSFECFAGPSLPPIGW